MKRRREGGGEEEGERGREGGGEEEGERGREGVYYYNIIVLGCKRNEQSL